MALIPSTLRTLRLLSPICAQHPRRGRVALSSGSTVTPYRFSARGVSTLPRHLRTRGAVRTPCLAGGGEFSAARRSRNTLERAFMRPAESRPEGPNAFQAAPTAWRSESRVGCRRTIEVSSQALLLHAEEDVVLGPEVIEKRPSRDTGPLGDDGRSRLSVAAFREQLNCGSDDAPRDAHARPSVSRGAHRPGPALTIRPL